MKKKVAKGLLAAVVVSNSVMSTTNMANAMGNAAELNALILTTAENITAEAENDAADMASGAEESVTVEAEKDFAAATNDAEENSAAVPEEPGKSDTNTENSTTATVESTIADEPAKSETGSQVAEEIGKTATIQAESASSISSTDEVALVSDDAALREAVKIDGKQIQLEQNIVLTEPLVVSGSNVVIDGNGKKIELNEQGSTNGFVIKPLVAGKTVDNVKVKNVTFENYTLNAVSLLNAKNILIENVTFRGKSNSNITRSNVGIDMDKSTATVKNVVSTDHHMAGIRLRNASELSVDKDGWNKHTNDANDIQIVSGKITDENQSYTAWDDDQTVYKVKTKKEVNNVTALKEALEIPNTAIILLDNIEINEKLEIKSKNITIDGRNFQIKVANGTNTASLVVKSENAVLKNFTIKNETTKPGITLLDATKPELSNVTIIGVDPSQDNKNRSGVGLDINNTKDVKLTNLSFKNSLYRDIQVKGGSTVEMLSKNTHSDGAMHIQTIQKTGEDNNKVNDVSDYYVAGVEYEESGEKKVDFFLKSEVTVTSLDQLLQHVQQVGSVINLANEIKVDKTTNIEVGRSVTINGNGNTLDLNGKGTFTLKGKDIVVKNLEVINSAQYGMNIYNSKNTILENVSVKNSLSHGIFVNGSTVELRGFTTSSNGAEGIKITRSRSMSSSSYFDSEVKVTGSHKQEESDIDVVIVNLDVNGSLSDNKFIPVDDTYDKHENEVKTTKDGLEQSIDYLVKQGQLDVTTQTTVTDASGNPIQLVGDGLVDNTENLMKLIEYAVSHSQTLYFPVGTYKITGDIDLTKLNLPAAANFRLIGDEKGLSIIDGSSITNKMLTINSGQDHAKLKYAAFENLVFNNVGFSLDGTNEAMTSKKAITLKNNAFMNGNAQETDVEPYIELTSIKNAVIENNIFLRGVNYPGRGIVTSNTADTTITGNFFGNLDGMDDAMQMIPNLNVTLPMIKASDLKDGAQANFTTAITNEGYDKNVLIQNNYFNLDKMENAVTETADAADNGDHIIYAKEYENLQIVGNYFKGQENYAADGVKIKNGKNAYIGANYFDDVLLLAEAETLLHNTVIYNNLFHQKTNFGMGGTGIVFDQSSDNADIQDFIIYQNEFKGDERDGIIISDRAQKAVDDGQFLAYDNKYKNMNKSVAYHGIELPKSTTLDEIEGQAANNAGFTLYKDAEIPLIPAKVEYKYLTDIYEKAQVFLGEIVQNDLVGDTPGKYPTDLVQQLQNMMSEIDGLYNTGELLQAKTNTFVTSLDKLYEVVINSKIPDNPNDENTPGDGNGSEGENNPGDGNGSEGENKPGDGNGSEGENNPGDSNGSEGENNPGDGDGSEGENNPEDGNNADGTVNKPTDDDQETIDQLPQTSDVFNRMLTALGSLLILAAGFLFMKRSKTE